MSLTSEGSFMFCFLSFGETKLEANNVLPLKGALFGAFPLFGRLQTCIFSSHERV